MRGAKERRVPILMAAAVTALDLAPLAIGMTLRREGIEGSGRSQCFRCWRSFQSRRDNPHTVAYNRLDVDAPCAVLDRPQ